MTIACPLEVIWYDTEVIIERGYMTQRQTSKALVPIFLTVFIDLLGLGMVIPIFALLFLDPVKGILPPSYSFAGKAMVLGLLVATYPFIQFFSAPLLGALSDRYGRKRILLLSQLGTTVGYVAFAAGIYTHNIPLLFLSRAIDGFTGGNISVATSAIADISSQETKTKNFGLIGAAFGVGFILGPVLGGRLADTSLVPWFSYATPFLFAAHLSAIDVLIIQRILPETLHTRVNTPISVTTGFRNIYRAFQIKSLRAIFAVIFLLACGFNIFAQFFQVFLIDRFHFNQVQIGNTFAYLGIWIALSQGVLIRPLADRFRPRVLLVVSSFFMALLLPLVLLPNKTSVLFYMLPLLALFQGIAQPSTTAIISNLTHENSQGEIIGINQSVQSLTQTIPPIVAGAVAAVDVQLPIIIGGLAVFLAWIIAVYFFKGKEKVKFEEI